MEKTLETLRDWIWGAPLLLLLLGFGAAATIRFFPQRRLGEGFRALFRDKGGEEGVSPFAALCTALAATIGTGNIVGVAAAICTGGPGALFWMVLAGLLGMATQYAEGFFAVKYRMQDRDGHFLGGPFLYIRRGLGRRFQWLGKAFACFAVFAGLSGVGTMVQSVSIASAAQRFFEPLFDPAGDAGLLLFGRRYAWSAVVAGLLTALAAAAVLTGGAARIAGAAEALVPFMAAGWFTVNLLLLVWNAERLPEAAGMILRGAFDPKAVTGGAVGSAFVALRAGVSRGVFTNEAGMGTAAIAAAAARTDSPERQGLASMTGTFVDTVVLCSMTGLSIVLTGAWRSGLNGAAVTGLALARGLPVSQTMASFLLMVSLVFFAFSTILGWHFYAERCLTWLTGGRGVTLYRWLYLLAVLLGPFLPAGAVWSLADAANGLMALPNLLALAVLSRREGTVHVS